MFYFLAYLIIVAILLLFNYGAHKKEKELEKKEPKNNTHQSPKP